jgi:hypothetical protein
MFSVKNSKEVYLTEDEATVRRRTGGLQFLSNVFLRKATSWDFIPGAAFKKINDINFLLERDRKGFTIV